MPPRLNKRSSRFHLMAAAVGRGALGNRTSAPGPLRF